MASTHIIELQAGADPTDVLRILQDEFPDVRLISVQERTWILCQGAGPSRRTGELPAVHRTYEVRAPYPLASREFISERTPVRAGPVTFGTGTPVIIAGPCSVESREQLMRTARHVAAQGGHMLRGGAFKPRTSPYSFQGLARQGLELLREAREVTGRPIVTEVLAPADVELVAEHADMLQIGARNMQNFPLLREVGRSMKPVLLKRSPWSDLATWLHAAEYILAEGNFQVVLCERGIVPSAAAAGRHLDMAALVHLREHTHLPVIIDPSHGTNIRSMVIPMAIAALLMGTDGLIIEVHANPAEALSDREHALDLDDFSDLMALRARLQQAEPDAIAA
jgi:3-deoxy-7-phosphoheptulonate synthase